MTPIGSVLPLPLPLLIVGAYTAGREAGSGRAALLGALGVGAIVALGQEFAPPGDTPRPRTTSRCW